MVRVEAKISSDAIWRLHVLKSKYADSIVIERGGVFFVDGPAVPPWHVGKLKVGGGSNIASPSEMISKGAWRPRVSRFSVCPLRGWFRIKLSSDND